MNGQAGKGDSRRPSSVSYEQYAANYNRIFRKGEPACGPGTTTEIGKSNPSGSTEPLALSILRKYLPAAIESDRQAALKN